MEKTKCTGKINKTMDGYMDGIMFTFWLNHT